VPVSFGFHPYLTLPEVAREDWHVQLPVSEHLIADDRGIPTGEREPAEPQSGPLGDRTYDHGYANLGDRPVFVLAGGGRRIDLTFERGYPYAQVYAPEGQPLICFEPMSAPTNALVSGELETVQPGGAAHAAFGIAVSGV
jgi:galactose mutarotase-like enzyme